MSSHCIDRENKERQKYNDIVAQEYYCGNGSLDDGEECDDGNSKSGDGCDYKCRKE